MASMKRKATSVKKNKGMSYEEAEAIYDKRANRTGKSLNTYRAAGKNLTVKEMEKLKSRGLSGKDVTEKERAAADKNLTMKEAAALSKRIANRSGGLAGRVKDELSNAMNTSRRYDKNLTMKEMEKLKKARLKMGKTKSE
jgi:hypothetical protein